MHETDDITAIFSQPFLALEKHLLIHKLDIEAWFRGQWQQTPAPFYGSVDLRNAGYKLAPVDTNLFPAGFNNLNPKFMSLYVQAVQNTLAESCRDVARLLLIPESHTRNLLYLESVAVLQRILISAGYDTRIGTLATAQELVLPSGKKLQLEPIIRDHDRVGVKGFFPCCIVLNNDLSAGIPDILQNLSQTVLPSLHFGWSKRLKSEHFFYYETVSNEFAKQLDFDPWLITPWFNQCPEINFMKKEGEQCLVTRAESLFKRLNKKYAEYNIQQQPFIVVKADQGTYGMAVMMIKSSDELRHLNRKQRTRMSTIKGGVPVTKAIIQEGVYSTETVDANHEKAVAEPVVYLFGRQVIGGFYRVHKNRGPAENLNAPGMNFQPLAFEEPCNLPSSEPQMCVNRFYLYGIVSRLALLAAAREFASFAGNF